MKTEADLRARLQEAALELFCERGYDRTTAAEIAARTGVTERTFFRHFPDKREVLFAGESVLRSLLTDSIADAPAGLSPLATLFRAFRSVETVLEANRQFSAPRQQVIVATPALQERELTKHAALADALTKALEARGIGHMASVLAGLTGMAAFVYATVSWLENPVPSIGERLDLAATELQTLLVEDE